MATKKSDDAGQAEVQAKFDEANEKGYFGTTPDDTPNEAYALPNAGEGTPEANRVHPDKARK